jgi:hypothetical protein
MKRIVVLCLCLALVLSACASPTPVTIVITATNEPVAPTDVPAPTDKPAPTDEPAATATEEPAPSEPTATATEKPGVAPTNTKPPAVGGAVLDQITRSGDVFSLRCAPSEITFSLVSLNVAITGVTLYYRVVDKNSTLAPPGMVNSKDMVGDKKGNFTLEFSALDVNPNLRFANGWFDYQFVAVNKFGDVVGRSDKFIKEVTFTLDCP